MECLAKRIIVKRIHISPDAQFGPEWKLIRRRDGQIRGYAPYVLPGPLSWPITVPAGCRLTIEFPHEGRVRSSLTLPEGVGCEAHTTPRGVMVNTPPLEELTHQLLFEERHSGIIAARSGT